MSTARPLWPCVRAPRQFVGIQLRHTALHPECLCYRSFVIQQQRRQASHVNRGARGTTAAPITPFNDPTRPLDERIESRTVHYVDSNGGLNAGVSLKALLGKLNRKVEHVQQVGTHGEDKLPIVKIRTKRDLRETEEIKLAQQKAQQSTLRSSKELELSWGVTRQDLEHRLRKLEEWLTEGRSVEVLIGKKRKGRTASQDECEELVNLVRDRALQLKGVSETKDMVGVLGGQAILTFKGVASGEATEGVGTKQSLKQERLDKMKRKEHEKERRRQEAEEKRERAEAKAKEKVERLKGQETRTEGN